MAGGIRVQCQRALRFKLLADKGRSTKVLCHGDLNPWNILRLEDGGLGLIDWDYLCLQWRERDLQGFCTDKDFSEFVRRYFDHLGSSSARISLGLLKYYRWAWELLLGADRVERIVNYEEGTGESLRFLWKDLNELWFQDFDYMEEYISGVSADLYFTKRLIP